MESHNKRKIGEVSLGFGVTGTVVFAVVEWWDRLQAVQQMLKWLPDRIVPFVLFVLIVAGVVFLYIAESAEEEKGRKKVLTSSGLEYKPAKRFGRAALLPVIVGCVVGIISVAVIWTLTGKPTELSIGPQPMASQEKNQKAEIGKLSEPKLTSPNVARPQIQITGDGINVSDSSKVIFFNFKNFGNTMAHYNIHTTFFIENRESLDLGVANRGGLAPTLEKSAQYSVLEKYFSDLDEIVEGKRRLQALIWFEYKGDNNTGEKYCYGYLGEFDSKSRHFNIVDEVFNCSESKRLGIFYEISNSDSEFNSPIMR